METHQECGKTSFPTAEEAEYTAAFCWSAGICIMKYFHDKGLTKIKVLHFPMVRCETGDRVAWQHLPPETMRKGAMRGIGARLRIDTGGPVRLRST